MKITNNEIIKETILNELKEIKVDRNNSISLYTRLLAKNGNIINDLEIKQLLIEIYNYGYHIGMFRINSYVNYY
jgi:hypothetical protein